MSLASSLLMSLTIPTMNQAILALTILAVVGAMFLPYL